MATVLRSLVDDRMDKTHRDFSTAASALADATTACPDGLPAMRSAWEQARLAWDAASVYRLGPAFDAHLAASVDYWPVDTARLDNVLTGDDVLTETAVDELGAGVRGLTAIERVLFGTTALNARRCSYVRGAAQAMAAATDAVVAAIPAWEGKFVARSDALVSVLSTLAESAYRVADEQLAMPAGNTAAALVPPDASLVHGSDGLMAVRDVGAQLTEIQQAVQVGIKPIIVARFAEAPDPIATPFAEAFAAVSALGPDLRRDIVEDNAAVVVAADRCRNVRRSFATNLAANLGVTLIIPVGDGD